MGTYFLDPALGTDTGAGTVGDPWGSTGSVLERALDSLITQGTVGDKICVKAGTADVLTKDLDFTTYGGPSIAKPFHLSGYTAAEDDEGLGAFDGNALYGLIATGTQYSLHLNHLSISNTSTWSVQFERYSSMQSCVVVGNCDLNLWGSIRDCSITSTTAYALVMSSACYGRNNWIHQTNGTGAVDTGAQFRFVNNIITTVGTASYGIYNQSAVACTFEGNSLLGGGSGTALLLDNSGNTDTLSVVDNLIEGYSTGVDKRTSYMGIFANNSFYNNTTDIAETSSVPSAYEKDNESLGASPFAKSGANTFANRLTYFAPVDTGSVFGGSVFDSSRDRGAIVAAAAAGSGGCPPIMAGR